MRTVFLPFFIERWNIQKYNILWLVLQKEENFITKTFKTNKTSGRWQSPVGATRTQAGDVSPCAKKEYSCFQPNGTEHIQKRRQGPGLLRRASSQ